MNAIHNLTDLLLHQLQVLHAVEAHQLILLPQLIEKAHHQSLKNALTHHLKLSKEQKSRLHQLLLTLTDNKFEAANEKTSNPKGISGLVAETTDLLQTQIAPEVIDAAIIACVQKIEHYEISGYGTAVAYAKQLHLHKAEDLLKETLVEEYDADDLLTNLAKASLNKKAAPEETIETATDDAELINKQTSKGIVHITECSIQSPGGRAGTSHRGYPSGESRGH
jgi:ferritin-like metal-binding protein YciE